ncbi:MAG: 3-oxoadipate enol-lactonase 2 [Paracidovorax wautersii]|uniref:3-oxoadipate enol-lactonase 2 n=1 Tax=Paracidovorax wautersii TaxID=1177982 RepID=A0A7V8FS69_9BURK|nr:MAG: 3-oxoadipate enol-lactonase 2 [Paracidovorax wautersii]
MSTTSLCTLATRNGDFRVAVDGPDDAPVLVFSNSLGTTLEMWDAQAAAFSGAYRVVRYDTRGHGGSPVTPGPYTLAQLGDDVLAVLDALQIQRAAFCGISMGGHTGLWLALHAPRRLTGVAVCNSAARIGSPEAWLERARQVREGGAAAMRQLADTAPTRWFTPDFVRRAPQTVAAAQAWIAGIAAEGYAACCEALAASDLRRALASIDLPMLLVAGNSDPVTTVADAEAMQQAVPGARLVGIPASHLSNLEAPQAFEQALAGWLAGLA